MDKTIIPGCGLLGIVPAERIQSCLDTAYESFGLALRLMDGVCKTLFSAPRAEESSKQAEIAEEIWNGLAGIQDEGACEIECAGGGVLCFAPVLFRGDRLGILAAYAPDRDRDVEPARRMLAVSSSHIQSLVDTAYEADSLSAEVVRVYEELALIYGMTARLGAIVDVQEVCRVVADEALRILDARDILVMLADQDAGRFRTVHAVGEHAAESVGFAPGLEDGLVGASYVGHRSLIVCEVDEDSRYTGWPYTVRRFLSVPFMAEGTVIGMLVATDKRDGEEFNTREEKLLSAMSSVAAVSIKNGQLYTDIKGLLEGFINASATAVESRDPTTAGHSARVALLSVELAKKVDASDLPVFRGVTFSPEDLMEIHYAGLLHDFGKIGVRETVLLKANKLSDEHMEYVRDRFAYIKERKLREALEAKLGSVIDTHAESCLQGWQVPDEPLAHELRDLDYYMRLIEMANNPRVLITSLPELERLEEIAAMRYMGPDGEDKPYLTRFEFDSLNVLKGSLSDKERREVESHVTHSYNFLKKVPWTKGFNRIADIVYTHHERLDGTGYPRGLTADEIPIQAKMMAVADVYDALTAWDRPYKEAVSTQKALFILDMEAQAGRLEPHIVQIFRDAAIFRKVNYMLPGHG